MQKESDILVGLSVGTTKMTVIVAARSPEIQVLGMGCSPSRGLSKGVIVNLPEATQSVVNAFREAENIVGKKISAAIVAFNSLDVSSVMTDGMVALGGREPNRVEVADLERVIEAAQSRLELSKNTLSVHTIPVRYELDGRPVDEPLNMTGMRLEMRLQTVSVPKTYVQNVIYCVEQAGVHVEGLVLKPLASSLGALTDEEMRAGCISISIGGGSTGIVLYQSGRPFKIMSIPIGGDHITSDLASVLRLSLRDAEDLKKRLFIDDENTLKSALREREIDTDRALEVIQDRLEELFLDHVRAALADYTHQQFPGGIVLSGGAALIPGIDDMLADYLKMQVRIASPDAIYSMPPGRKDTSYVSAAGLLRYLAYRKRYSYRFIEPTPSELRLSPVDIERVPDSYVAVGPETVEPTRIKLKNFLQYLGDRFKELF